MRHAQRLVGLLIVVLAARSATGAGLLAPTDQTLPPLRITDHLVEAAVHDGVAVTTVRQTFRNDTDRRLEATYVFPLPEDGDLTDFQMSFNGKMVEGRILPKEEARQVYESIVRQSKDPGLIEFIGRRLLQMRVFPIEPRSNVRIQLRYQQICRPVSGMQAYHYPLRTGAEGAGGRAYGTVRFAVTLATAAPLKTIWSPTHSVEIVRQGEHEARVAYEASGASLDEDFLLLYATDSSDLGLSAVAYKPDETEPGHFVLMLTPRQLWPQEQREPQDVVFVLDTSGSMASDEKLDQAKEALKYCVSQLDERDRFSVVRFSTGFDVLFDPPRSAGPEARAEAQRWIDQFRAAGGTNIADTLTEVVRLRDDAGRPFVVIFLTDGQGNRQPDDIMTALAAATGPTEATVRIFPFGVGHDVNTVLLDRLATTYRGRPTYVQPGENLELVLGDFFSIISRPVLTNVKLALPDIGATERFPAVLGDLYHGQQLTVAGRFASGTVGSVRLTAMRGGEQVSYEWPEVPFVHTAEATYVPAVWAGRKIAYLVDQIRMHGETPEMVEEILALSQAHGIQTPYSSWLVDPERTQVAIREAFGRLAPGRGAGGLGGGAGADDLFFAGERIEAQRRLLSRHATGATLDQPAAGGATGAPVAGPVDLKIAVGAEATVLAERLGQLRDQLSADASRLSTTRLARQRIGDRWYNRVGAVLVDERIDETTVITAVRFGSGAYFDLVELRPDLRPALARSRSIAVLVAPDRAILVDDTGGIDSLDDELRQLIQG